MLVTEQGHLLYKMTLVVPTILLGVRNRGSQKSVTFLKIGLEITKPHVISTSHIAKNVVRPIFQIILDKSEMLTGQEDCGWSLFKEKALTEILQEYYYNRKIQRKGFNRNKHRGKACPSAWKEK